MYEISQVERPTQPADVLTLPGAAELDDYENRVQEAAEFVAARHIDTRSPEWVEFVWDRIDRATTAALLRGDLTVLQPLREEFTEWIVDSYRDGGTFYNEMRRELGL